MMSSKGKLLCLALAIAITNGVSAADVKGKGYDIRVPDICTARLVNSVEDFDVYSVKCGDVGEFGMYVGNAPQFPRRAAEKGQRDELLRGEVKDIYRIYAGGRSVYEEVLEKQPSSNNGWPTHIHIWMQDLSQPKFEARRQLIDAISLVTSK